MAATVTWGPVGQFDPYTRDQAPFYQKLKFADGSAGTAAQRATAQAELMGLPDFKAEVQATTDTSSVAAMNLTDEGVTFPARTIREIRGRSWCLTDNDTYFYEWTESVLGGTTPVLLGQKIDYGWAEDNGVASEYGRVHFKATLASVATPTVVFASKGLAIAAITSGAADFTVPRNRLCLVKGANFGGSLATTSAQATKMTVDTTNLDGAGSGTDAIQFWDVNGSSGTAVAADNPATGANDTVDLAFEIWPAHNHKLTLDSNDVTVTCTAVDAIGDDNLKHVVEIFVGPAKAIGYSAA